MSRLSTLTTGVALPLTPESRRLLSFVIVEAANLWAQYSRSFYYSIALGARDAGGRRLLVTPAPSFDVATDLAVHTLHPKLAGQTRSWKSYEMPDWQNKGHLSRLVRTLAPAVWPDVDRAVSYPTRVLSDLPTMRNFYAHKAERAARSARNLRSHYGITTTLSPHELLCTPPTPASDVLVNEWLLDLAAILNLMP